jgi:ammonium transporter, Amt family
MGKARARSLVIGTAGIVVLLLALAAGTARAQSAPAPAAAADLATRVADLEAYVTNGTPKVLSSPGPGHNAWMMTSTAWCCS